VDFGCGRGGHAEDPVTFRRNLRCFKGRVATIIGLDVDSAGETNPCLDEFRHLTQDAPWAVETGWANLIICDFVIEHLSDPGALFHEARRVLAPGGYLCIRTPNAHSYVGIISRLVPNKHHAKITSKAQADRKEEDVFPTLYRCNTISAIRRQMRLSGFQSLVYGYEAEPSYLEFSKLAYALGVLHQKYACSFMRPVILAFGRVPE
jgi:SAM-dependent methyltransferase